MSMNHLPLELLNIILCYYGQCYIPVFRHVSKQWRSIINKNILACKELRNHDDWTPSGDCGLNQVTLDGHLSIIQWILSFENMSYTWYCHIMYTASTWAAIGGHVHILEYARKRYCFGVVDWNRFLCNAAEAGHIEVVKLCYENGAFSINAAMERAAEGGYAHIVQLCKDWGADVYYSCMRCAAKHGHVQIVLMCKNWILTDIDYNDVMGQAAFGGHANIVQLCMEWGADDCRNSMHIAALKGHAHILQMCNQWCLNAHQQINYNELMCTAASGGHVSVVQLMRDWGATNYDSAMWAAGRDGHVHLLLLFLEWGIDITSAFAAAVEFFNASILRFFHQMGQFDMNVVHKYIRKHPWSSDRIIPLCQELGYM